MTLRGLCIFGWVGLTLSGCVGTATLTDVESVQSGSPAPGPGPGPTPSPTPTPTPTDAGTVVVDAGVTPPVVDAGSTPPVPDAGSLPPGPCGTLDTRVIQATIDVRPASVDVGSSYGWSNNRPVHFAGLTDGSARVAWSSNGTIHITPLNAMLARLGPDLTTAGVSVRGFVAHDDGSVALLVVRGTEMHLVKLRSDGSNAFDVPIVADPPSDTEGARWVDNWGHEGRLLVAGNAYVAYFGHTRHWGAMGKHQGDLLASFDVNTGARVGGPAGWDWGCSHSLDVRLAWDGARVAPVCLSDCYRTKGVLLDDSTVLSDEPSGNCAGSSNGELGGLAGLAGGGFAVTFSTTEGRSSRDVAFRTISSQGTPGPVVWLAMGAGDERAPHLARYGADRLLASWVEGGDSKLAVLSAAGVVLEGPVTASVAVDVRDDFARYPGGDVGWASGGGGQLQVSRIRSCIP